MRFIITGVLLCVVFVLSGCTDKKSATEREREKYLAELSALPPVKKDFTTPEGAILLLEDAYRHRDIEAAVAAKDFKTEARLMLQKTGFKDAVDDALVAKTAEVLELSFRSHTTNSWPNLDGLKSFFPEKKQYTGNVVAVTEACLFPDGGFSHESLLVAETTNGGEF
ncbi:MAG TPA: hypothetical protein VIW47_01610 [Nitrospiraceae bacterium]|jgi:hypothetical protein